MECNKCCESVSFYIDGFLTNEEKILFEEHTKDCEKCRIELEETKKLIASLKSIPLEELPERLHSDIMKAVKKVSESKVRRRPLRHAYARFGTLAASLILIVGVFGIMRNMPRNNDFTTMPQAESTFDTPMPAAAAAPAFEPFTVFDSVNEELDISRRDGSASLYSVEVQFSREYDEAIMMWFDDDWGHYSVFNRTLDFKSVRDIETGAVFSLGDPKSYFEDILGHVESNSYIYHVNFEEFGVFDVYIFDDGRFMVAFLDDVAVEITVLSQRFEFLEISLFTDWDDLSGDFTVVSSPKYFSPVIEGDNTISYAINYDLHGSVIADRAGLPIVYRIEAFSHGGSNYVTAISLQKGNIVMRDM